jgi:AAA+ superfamily predicted ATPase
VALRSLSGAEDVSRQQLGWYLRKCAESPVAGQLERIILARLDRLRGNSSPDWVDEAADDHLDARSRNRRRRELSQLLKQYGEPPPSDEGIELNAAFAREEFNLDDVDTEILLLLLRYERNGELEQLADEVAQRLQSPIRAVAALLSIDWRQIQSRLASAGSLMSSGLLSLVGHGYCSGLAGHNGYLQLATPLRKVMQHSFASRRDWVSALVGRPLTSSLQWEDFDHLGATRDLAAQLIAAAVKAAARGVNVLIYGPVGTGKTEFAKVLGYRARAMVWSVGETDQDGGEPSRGDRLAALRLSQRILARRRKAMLLLDEAEDVLSHSLGLFGPLRDGSKLYVNRLLEENPVPVVWTCNEVTAIDPAILRRMTLAIEVRTPSRPVRARIWRRVLSGSGLRLDVDAADRLAARYSVPAAVAAGAVRVARLTRGGEAAVDQALGSLVPLLGSGTAAPEVDGGQFDPALVNCRDDVSALIEQLARPGVSRRWSLCLHGAPGTGKSGLARHLANRLGMEVVQQRASDLLSCWVGDTERQIASAFQSARTRRAMLVFDEADSLLADRRGAARSWEVTQVNEMLTWMESHALPFVCTTNLMDRLDPASLRRFTFKLRLDALTPAQAEAAFQHFFGVAAPRSFTGGLTPGDFVTVRRKRDLLGDADAELLAGWLDAEAEAKEPPKRALGFVIDRSRS